MRFPLAQKYATPPPERPFHSVIYIGAMRVSIAPLKIITPLLSSSTKGRFLLVSVISMPSIIPVTPALAYILQSLLPILTVPLSVVSLAKIISELLRP